MNRLVALVLLSGCVKHFDIDTVYREKREEGVYRVLMDQYGGCAVEFRAKRVGKFSYSLDSTFYDSLVDEWCE